MIQVRKSATVPAVLTTAGTAARQVLEQVFDADPAACRATGSRRLNVAATIYNDAAVKQQLIADQYGKCCYCEAYVQHVGYGDVEHYRPKNGYKQDSRDRQLGKPGYYWLAFDWQNLLFVCDRCNRGHKRNLFPLRNPAGRAGSHHQSVAQEQPLLLHPVADDPEQHIGFRKATAVGKTPKGRTTIKACGLNRPKTLEHRRAHYGKLERDEMLADIDLAAIDPVDIRRLETKYGSLRAVARRIQLARDSCRQAVLDAAEYAGMARVMLR